MTIFERFRLKGEQDEFTIAVASPHDDITLRTLHLAFEKNIVTKVYLCGKSALIKQLIEEHQFHLPNIVFVHSETDEAAANDVGRLIQSKEADVPMKGMLDTSVFLKAMLNKEFELLKGLLLAHVMLVHRDEDDKFFIVSDGGMNIAPTLEQKRDIILNAVEMAHAIGLNNPVVIPLTAKEKVYSKMPATGDAAELQEMNQNGEIPGCRVSGPLQFDLAISKESAEIKGVQDPLAGEAEILIVPTIETGNVLVKALTYLAGFSGYGLIVGAKVPMILVSRADGEKEKIGSIYLARLMFEGEKYSA